MTEPDTGTAATLPEYDARAWKVLAETEAQAPRKLLPAGVRGRLSRGGDAAKSRLEKLPGAERFETLFMDALGGLSDFGARAAQASMRPEAVLKAFRKRGFDVASIDDIRRLELSEIDAVKPRLDLAYVSASMVEGVAAGLAVSGGQIVVAGGAVFGAGAGAAPGAGLVVGAMAADAAAVLIASQRAVAHVAAYYGYDIEQPEERVYALGVLGVGTASEVGKAAAYAELNKIVHALARRQTWKQLNERVATRVVAQVYARLGMRLTQRKLGQAVPVVGAVIGAGLNARMLSRVVAGADHAYRKRFLQDRYGLTGTTPEIQEQSDSDASLDITDIVDAEIVESETEPDR